MKLIENAELVGRVICLIKRRSTGDATTLASKLGMCERNVYRLISEMKESGFPVKYSSEGQTYYFEDEVTYEFRITVGNQDLLKIKGGSKSCLDFIGFQNLYGLVDSLT